MPKRDIEEARRILRELLAAAERGDVDASEGMRTGLVAALAALDPPSVH